MTADDRVQAALAAYLEAQELGDDAPDVSSLSSAEQDELRKLIALLGDTEGIAFTEETPSAVGQLALTDAGRAIVEALRDIVPPGSRITIDPAASTYGFDGPGVVEGWIIGTFGGRVRVWLLADATPLSRSDGWFGDLERAFRLFGDTVAIALVEKDGSTLLVQPQDCSPTIEVPRGSLVGRRYRRPIAPVREALSVFLRELVPYWEPMEDITDAASARPMEVAPVASEHASQAIDEQIAAGARARKTNPKRSALSALGQPHADSVAKLVMDVQDGRVAVDELEAELRRLATGR